MKNVVLFLIVGILIGIAVLILASVVSSCYFFISTFTLDDFGERTTSFVFGVVSALFTYGIFRGFLQGMKALSERVDEIKKKL